MILALVGTLGIACAANVTDSDAPSAPGSGAGDGEFVVCLVGLYKPGKNDCQVNGMKVMADIAHSHGFPVTWYLKPPFAAQNKNDLKKWNNKYGDEVGWFSERWNTISETPDQEVQALKDVVDWQPIRAAGQVNYDANWVDIFRRNGITSVWGRCWEQTISDAICDRGCPWGFYYMNPNCYTAPNAATGGLVSVEWASRDLNLTFRTGWAEQFSFVSYDAINGGLIYPGQTEYWFRLVDEYRRQAKYNSFVPMIVMLEFGLLDPENEDLKHNYHYPHLATVMDELLYYLRKQKIKVVSVSEAVERYRTINAERTPPTYAYFDNLSRLPVFKDPIVPFEGRKNPPRVLRVQSNRITKSEFGHSYNGYYANDWPTNGSFPYVHPTGKTFEEQSAAFIYYDVSGQLFFDPGNPKPIRITSYLNIPEKRPAIIEEYSYWYDTDKLIPTPVIQSARDNKRLQVTIKVQAERDLPYGVVLWGDYSDVVVPEAERQRGSKVIGKEGLFIPMRLKQGLNELTIAFALEIK
jgi:hypothetical protein